MMGKGGGGGGVMFEVKGGAVITERQLRNDSRGGGRNKIKKRRSRYMVSKQRYRARHGQRRRSCQKMLSYRGEIWEKAALQTTC